MASLFDGPKSVVNDITKIMQQSHQKKVSGFVDEAMAKGKSSPKEIAEYARRVKNDSFARDVMKAAQEKLK